MRMLVPLLCLLLGCASGPPADETPRDREAAGWLKEGKVRKAREAFLKSAHDHDDHYVAWVGIAHCEAALGRSAAFENAALRASANAPRTVRAQDRLGRLYIKAAERFREGSRARHYAGIGVEYLRRVFAAAPRTRNLNYNLGLGLALTEDDAAARVLLRQAHREEPKRLDIAHVYLLVLQRLDQPRDAQALLAEFPAKGRPVSWGEIDTWSRRGAGEKAASATSE